MSIISLSPCPAPSSGGGRRKEKSENELAAYKTSMSIEYDVHQATNYINQNVQNKGWKPRGLRIPHNSEFAYAIPQVAISLFLGKETFVTDVYDIRDLNTLSEFGRS